MSSRSVHQRLSKNGKEKLILPSYPKLKDEVSTLEPHTIATCDVDWTLLLDDMNWWFCGIDTTDAIIYFKAHNLHDISDDYRRKLSDATLSLIVVRHELLKCLQLGSDFYERITSDDIKAMAICCNKLKKLRLSRIMDVQGDEIDALAKYCPKLIGVGFLDCLKVDGMALSKMS
ncbi:hypothetical protein SAY86_013304 [Trapa natans]|uniref:Uncharacterized protein n=1 Tax=Trapa natans TaxID=22666 RepID=A0AAN7MEB1_TRANT|nr:hypothetical protein SAY86_013304 [Trapa natans]